MRPMLLAAARSPRAERTVTGFPVTRTLVDRFVAGESLASALATVRELLQSGRFVSIDFLGEDTVDPAQARLTVDTYLALIDELSALAGDSGDVRPVEVSVKLSALGQALPRDGHRIALDNARAVVRAAHAAGVWVTFDAEDHTTTDSTHAIVRELRRDFPQTVGTVLQAYLHRTEDDCRAFAAEGARIRLCKGAYDEPESVAFRRKPEVDASYLRCLSILMAGSGYPMVASHDPVVIGTAELLATAAGRGNTAFEYQMLYGIRDAEQARLVTLDRHVRVYVPFGDQWYGYFIRRLAERPANVAFFLRSATSRK
ncbi:proline dehydrogenase [Nocardia uniformis]|uniref:proline dehydrogenase n=1 Tax=Nocardia uniformis TaxID=53432 RepID=A0A849CFX8_9NOCA|nr:proline dehydrogenase family protein [Nocardia uniformis]NNH72341.1 proline dehydrogenase [Nocardia uniformis]